MWDLSIAVAIEEKQKMKVIQGNWTLNSGKNG